MPNTSSSRKPGLMNTRIGVGALLLLLGVVAVSSTAGAPQAHDIEAASQPATSAESAVDATLCANDGSGEACVERPGDAPFASETTSP